MRERELMEHLLEKILTYEMTKEEAKAWKIAIIYLKALKEYFPSYRHFQIPKNDPRKSNLFRYCYKLLRETQGKLEFKDYQQYIHAQLQILKNIKLEDEHGEFHGQITPDALVGEGAWNRWLVWKKKFDHVAKIIVQDEVNVDDVVKQDLERTKKFLVAKFEKVDNSVIKETLVNRSLFRWCALGRVSPYFLVLSPTVSKFVEGMNLLENFAIDLNYYRGRITNRLRECYIEMFSDERP